MSYQPKSYRKFVATAASAALVASAVAPAASFAAEDVKVKDIDGHRHQEAIETLLDLGVLQGFPDDTFRPDTTVTRAEAAIMIARSLDLLDGENVPSLSFTDVGVKAKAFEAIAKLADKGVVSGFTETQFKPDETVTRGQMAKMIANAYELELGTGDDTPFSDVTSNVSTGKYISAIYNAKIAQGYENGKFGTEDGMKRGDFAKITYNAMDYAGLIDEEPGEVDVAVESITTVNTTTLEMVVDGELTDEQIAELKLTFEPALEVVKIERKVVPALFSTNVKTILVITTAEQAPDVTYKLVGVNNVEIPAEEQVEVAPAAVAVSEVTATDATTVVLTVGKELKADDLKNKEITLTDAEDIEVTATFLSVKDGKASFKLTKESELVDAVTYTVTADWAKFTQDTFVAKVMEAYVAEFEAVTTGITATPYKDDKPVEGAKAEITVKANDQYGEEIDVPAAADLEVTVNGMPLTIGEEKSDEAFYKNGKVTIKKVLKEADEVVISLTPAKVGDKELDASTFNYTVLKYEDAIVTKVNVTAKETSLPAKKATDLTVNVLDQFNNTLTDDAAEVRFVVNGKVVDTSKSDALIQENGDKYTFKSDEPGEYTIEVFSTVDTKVKGEIKIAVGAAELTELVVETETITDDDKNLITQDKYNNEELIVASIAPNKGAEVLPENIKFDIQPGKDLSKDDITVKAEKVTVKDGKDSKDIIIVKATTTKAGTFTVKPYVGEKVDAEDAAVGNKVITVITELNPTVESISEVTFDKKELKVGAEIKKDIVFKNKHGETLLINSEGELGEKDVIVTSSNDTVATGKVEIQTDEETKEQYTQLIIDGEKAGTTVITVQAGDQVATYTLKFVDAELTKVDVGEDVTGVVAGDRPVGFETPEHNDKAKYNELKFFDQDDQEITLGEEAEIEASVKGPKDSNVTVDNLLTFGKYTAPRDDTEAKFDKKENANEITHIQVLPASGVKEGSYEITITVKDGEKEVTGKFNIEVGAERALDKVTAETKSTIMTTGGETTVLLTPVDQYGNLIAVTDPDTNITLKNNDVVEFVGGIVPIYLDKDGNETIEEEDNKLKGYQVTVKGKANGTVAAEFNVKIGDITKSITQSFKVDSVDELIDSVVITEVPLQDNSATGESKKVELKATGKDVNGNDIEINAGDLTWSVKSVKDKDGNKLIWETFEDEPAEATTEGNDGNGEDTTDPQYVYFKDNGERVLTGITDQVKFEGNNLEVPVGKTLEVEVEVKTSNLKTDTTTVKFDGKAPEFVSDLRVATVAGEPVEGDEGLKITIEDVATQDIKLTFSGIDQYGNVFEIDDAKGEMNVTFGTSGVLGKEISENGSAPSTLTLTAISSKANKVNAYVEYKGEQLAIEITVAKEVVEYLKAKEGFEKAVITADGKGILLPILSQNPTTEEYLNATKAIYDEIAAVHPEVKSAKELAEALDSSKVKTITLTGSFTTDGFDVKNNITINGNGNTLTLTGKSANKHALGLLVSGTSTIENLTIVVPKTMEDNAIEVMGNNAALTLKDVTVKDFKQAGIYVGGSTTSSESLTLEGNIKFVTDVKDAWGGIGVRGGAALDVNGATITYDGPTVDIFNTEKDAKEDNDNKVSVLPVIWTESSQGDELTGSEKYDAIKISKISDDGDSKDFRYKDESSASQVIFTFK